MNLKSIAAAVGNKTARPRLVLAKHSPHILFVGGIVGVTTATVLACRATLTVDAVVAEAQEKLKEINQMEHVHYSEDDRVKDKGVVYVRTVARIGKLYAPSAGLMLVSVAALTKSHTILNKRNAGLAAAYAALEKGFNEYRDRVRQDLGDERDREFRYGVTPEHTEVQDGRPVTIKEAKYGDGVGPSIYARFFDETNPNWTKRPDLNKIFLKANQEYFTDRLRARGHLFLNEVYDQLGMDHTSAGALVGWIIGEGDDFVDLGIFDGQHERRRAFVNGDEPSILLDFNVCGTIYDKINGGWRK